MSDQNDTSSPQWEVSEQSGGKLIALTISGHRIGSALYDPPSTFRAGEWSIAAAASHAPRGGIVTLPVVRVRTEDDARKFLLGVAALAGRHPAAELSTYTACEGADAEQVGA